MECSLIYVGDQSEENSTKLYCMLFSYLHGHNDDEIEELSSDLEDSFNAENENLLEMEDL